MQIDPTPAQLVVTLAMIADALDRITAETWQRTIERAAGLRLTSALDGALLLLRYNPQTHRFVISGSLWLSLPDQPSANLAGHFGRHQASPGHTITASADKPPRQSRARSPAGCCPTIAPTALRAGLREIGDRA